MTQLDEAALHAIATERMEKDWRGRTTWDGDTRPAEHVEQCKEDARWYVSRYLAALPKPDEAALEKAAWELCKQENYCMHPESKQREEFDKHKPYYRANAEAAITAYLAALPKTDKAALAECREAFEKKFKGIYSLLRASDGSYILSSNECAWEGFQAAWSSRPREAAPEVVEVNTSEYPERVWLFEPYPGILSWTRNPDKGKVCYVRVALAPQPQMAGDVVEQAAKAIHDSCAKIGNPELRLSPAYEKCSAVRKEAWREMAKAALSALPAAREVSEERAVDRALDIIENVLSKSPPRELGDWQAHDLKVARELLRQHARIVQHKEGEE